ncbi:hypothetical protein [Filimonas lacunae]|nr:hypothetical protein [Filimonas lacunae]BAV06517.1 hypothetical protein FLA_2536 [Filimonas lacunae]
MLSAICFVLAAVGCKKDDDVTPPVYTNNELYANAILDAMVADSTEKVDTLWPISGLNNVLKWKVINGKEYVKMSTFMRFPGSYPEGDSITNTWGESWMFIPDQMKLHVNFNASSDTIMRICQLLGLPPKNSKSNTHIVTLWVPANRLVRPAGNPDIASTSADARLISTVSADYATWFNNYIIYAYYHTLQSDTDFHYPWTRLGYTYDWSPDAPNKVGLSEYVLQANTGIWVDKVYTASDYFK